MPMDSVARADSRRPSRLAENRLRVAQQGEPVHRGLNEHEHRDDERGRETHRHEDVTGLRPDDAHEEGQ